MTVLMLGNGGGNCLCETPKDRYAVVRRLGPVWACASLVTFLVFTVQPTSEAASSAATSAAPCETGRSPRPAYPTQCGPSPAGRHE